MCKRKLIKTSIAAFVLSICMNCMVFSSNAESSEKNEMIIAEEMNVDIISERDSEAKEAESQVPEAQASESQVPEAQLPETQISETQVPEAQLPETQIPETQVPEAQLPETQIPETQVPESQAPETQMPESQVPETQMPEIQMPESQAPETQIPETQIPEIQIPETQEAESQAPEIQMPESQVPETQMPETEMQETVSESETGMTEIFPDEEMLEMEMVSEQITEEETEEEPEGDLSEFYSPYSTNAELIAHQNIVRPTKIQEFRFIQIAGMECIVKKDARVYEEMDIYSRKIAIAEGNVISYILEECGENWYYIEKETVRGFVKAEDITKGRSAELIINRLGKETFLDFKELVPAIQNKAVDYTHTTVYEVIADKKYAVAKKNNVNIYDAKKSKDANIVGVLPKDGLVFILADEDEKMVFVESGNVRGFITSDLLNTGVQVKGMVEKHGEAAFALAEMYIKPEDNAACYYTLTSVKEADKTAELRNSIVDFALEYVGYPYVWGGTSLTNGADCSGFVQTIYAEFGFYIPRVACYQAEYGMQIPIDAAEPGDLIFYAKDGYVYHVSMYIGDGKVVHAYSTDRGIIVSGIEESAVWATNVIG